MAFLPPFADLAAAPDASLDVLALALASEFREVDAAGALQALDDLGDEVAHLRHRTPSTPAAESELDACVRVLGGTHGFTGDREQYDDPANSMLDVVLETRRGLPILLAVVYVEVARRVGIPLAGVGLSGHFFVGHFGPDPPLLIDPFAGGAIVNTDAGPDANRPWRNHEIVMRMLNNLVGSYQRRGEYDAAIRAARMRLALPSSRQLRDQLRSELVALQARLN
jgi:regulator of sirC expression with transglutaminase-like and TPR domain